MKPLPAISSADALATHWWRSPFVMRGDSASWSIPTLEHVLTSALPRGRAEVYSEGLLTPNCAGPTKMGLKRALRRLARETPNLPSPYALITLSPRHWHKLLQQLEQIPSLLFRVASPEDACAGVLMPTNLTTQFESLLRWRMLALAGDAGAGFHMHVDFPALSNYHVQLRGAKHWALCPPIGDDGSNDGSNEGEAYCHGAADAFAPPNVGTNAECPAFDNASCFDAVLRPGDGIFYPSLWYHQTRTLEKDTASLSRSLLTYGDAKHFAKSMRRICAMARVLDSHRLMCNALDPCLRRLEMYVDVRTA